MIKVQEFLVEVNRLYEAAKRPKWTGLPKEAEKGECDTCLAAIMFNGTSYWADEGRLMLEDCDNHLIETAIRLGIVQGRLLPRNYYVPKDNIINRFILQWEESDD